MLIVVYGEDTFRAQEKVKSLREAFQKKFDPTGMNLSVFPAKSGEKLVAGEVLQAVCSMPFLTPKRMVVIRDLIAGLSGKTGKKDDAEVWADGLARVPESTICVLWETLDSKEIEKKALFKEIKKQADLHVYPFSPLDGVEFTKWIAARVSERGGTIDREAVASLAERVGPDLWQMDNEIAKLVAISNVVSKALVEEHVRPSFEGEIFALMDAVSQKNVRSALQLLEQERLAGSDDFYLLSMLIRQVRILLSARALLDENPRATKEEAADALGIHPFVASKALTQARAFTYADLRAAHELLFQYELAIKTGGMNAGLAVDLVATKLLS